LLFISSPQLGTAVCPEVPGHAGGAGPSPMDAPACQQSCNGCRACWPR